MIKVEDGYVEYPCGCKFEIADKGPPIRIKFDPYIENIPLNCKSTWNLIGSGNTKGIFQFESRFGQQYAKKLMPENIEQLAGLASIMRPGCINAMEDNKSVAEHYMDRKNLREENICKYPVISHILDQTYNCLVYQESAMKIAQEIAGFTLQEADELRKAAGKKKADLMAKIKVKFLDGCKKLGKVAEEEASEIFGWIEASQRYSFNKSHAVSYAYNAYLSAYAKAHFIYAFFTSYLYYAKDKQDTFDEIKLLVNNARVMGVDIKPPDFRHVNKHFKHIGRSIFFGFTDIKGIGESSVDQISTKIYQVETALNKKNEEWTWLEFLIYLSQNIKSTVVEGIIESGALDYFKVDRSKMLFEYEQYSIFTGKEQTWIQQHVKLNNESTLSDVIQQCLQYYDKEHPKVKGVKQDKPFHNKNRIKKAQDIVKTLKTPPYSIKDNADWIARVEEARLGVSLTASPLDMCKNLDQANCTCLEFINHQEPNTGIFIAAYIEQVKTCMTRNEEEMVFITLGDTEATLDAVIWPNDWEIIKKEGVCIEDNMVIVGGERSQKGTLVIKRIWQLK